MQEPIVIVSGLPRSGTSLLMQMLAAGGLPILTDGARRADADNPRGYFEDERVKRLQHDVSWLVEARGKAVKVVSHLLFALPPTEEYQLILMDRDLDEVLASQAAMLARSGKSGGDPARVRDAAIAHLSRLETWLPLQAHYRTLRLRHADVLADAAHAARRVSVFLGQNLDDQAMAVVVEPSLYRNRKAK